MLQNILANPITNLQYLEIQFNELAQKTLHFAEPVWIVFSELMTPVHVLDILVPLVGVFHHQLMVRLVCSLSVINALSSLLKWCYPTHRPYWWIHEVPFAYNTSAWKQHALTCESTAGFPSSHTLCFTTFAYLVTVFTFAHYYKKYHLDEGHLQRSCYLAAVVSSVGMWLSRVYFACQFLHQCVLSSLLALVLLRTFDRYSGFLYTLERVKAVMLVVCCGVLPIAVHFAMLRMDVDPLWSVRMAFKWCADPSFLRHEASPIFVLGRDFGYLMGVALSTPLYKRYESKPTIARRIPTLLLLELLNHFVRNETPKQRGRFIFVAYEFTRNMMHSYLLLSVVSKII